jgi:hypothetical protein
LGPLLSNRDSHEALRESSINRGTPANQKMGASRLTACQPARMVGRNHRTTAQAAQAFVFTC